MSSTPFRALNDNEPTVRESSTEDLAVLRNLLDLALQPLDSFAGFSHVEQILLGALRYQLNGLGWALSLAQATRTPAFSGYLADAQRAAILKMCDKRVWGYWAYQELIGYRRWNPDPIVHANVMYSGYLGVMIGLYETLNADRSLDRPDALTLRWNRRRTFRYGFAELAQAVHRNMLEYPACPQYPCEPHLIYPICNTFALNTLRMHDRLHGSAFTGDLVERVRASYDDDRWRRQAGRFVTGRTRFGLTFLGPTVGNDAWMAYWLHALMPDIANDTWALIRQRHIKLHDGQAQIDGGIERRIDVGNYSVRQGGGPTYTMVMKTAREMGALDVYAGIDRFVHERYPLEYAQGAARHKGMSNLANFLAAMARFGGPGVMRDLIDGRLPEHVRSGPKLTRAPYPDVLVARATTDGHGLDLVLRPGAGAVDAVLRVEQLVPHAHYAITGATVPSIHASHDGTADVPIRIHDRTAVLITPGRTVSLPSARRTHDPRRPEPRHQRD